MPTLREGGVGSALHADPRGPGRRATRPFPTAARRSVPAARE